MLVLNDIIDQLDRQASKSTSRQKKDSLSTQLVPEPIPIQTTSIQEDIHFYQVNKL